METLVLLGLRITIGQHEIKPHHHQRQTISGQNVGAPLHRITTLTDTQNEQLQTFLRHELQSFSLLKGPATVGEHKIRMKHDRPITARYTPRNPAMQAVINEEIDELLANDQIEPSNSPYTLQWYL